MTDWWTRIRELEPARLRAAWAAIIAVAVALGVTVSADVDTAVQAAIVLFAALVPLIQGEATRRKVTPVAKLRAEERDAIDMHNYESDGEPFVELGE